jgi:uncharacterized protein (DUF924 family)
MRDTKQEVLRFWFEETAPAQWFQKNDVFDDEVRERFHVTYDMAAKDLCGDWSKDAEGVLALCIVLDQFPRNMFRGTPKAYATDEKALLIAKAAINKGFDQLMVPVKRRFLYLPFEHSENLNDQKRSVTLFESMKDSDPLGYEYALKHYEVIDKFGRFPHRNAVLGRESTDEELKYLNLPGAGF